MIIKNDNVIGKKFGYIKVKRHPQKKLNFILIQKWEKKKKLLLQWMILK